MPGSPTGALTYRERLSNWWDEKLTNWATRGFLTSLFLTLILYEKPNNFDEEMDDLGPMDAADPGKYETDGKPIPRSTKKKNKFRKAFFSSNTLIAALGLGFGYIGIHLFVWWGWSSAAWVAAATIATAPWGGPLILGLALLVGFSLWHARLIFLKNLVYLEKKQQYKSELAEVKYRLKERILTYYKHIPKTDTHTLSILVNSHFEKFSKEFESQFNETHAGLIAYNKMQNRLEPIKKFSRTLMLFGIIFAIEAATGLPLEILIPAGAAALIVTIIDIRSKDNRHDLKLRKLREQIIALKTAEIRSLDTDKMLKDIPLSDPYVTLSDHSTTKFFDNFLAFIGITAGYIAINFITLFSLHEWVQDAGNLYFDIALFGIPSLIGFGISLWNIYANNKLYQFYQQQEASLQKVNHKIDERNTYLIKLGCTLSTKASSPLFCLQAENNESKINLDRMEGFKKTVRILILAGVLLGAGFGLPGLGIGLIIIAVAIGYADYKVRRQKAEIEGRINELKVKQLELLDKQQNLLSQYYQDNTLRLRHKLAVTATPQSVPRPKHTLIDEATSQPILLAKRKSFSKLSFLPPTVKTFPDPISITTPSSNIFSTTPPSSTHSSLSSTTSISPGSSMSSTAASNTVTIVGTPEIRSRSNSFTNTK